MRCRKRTLCRGLEYASACHIYVFISKNERYSPIKLCSTTGLLYNYVTSQKIPMESLDLHRGCPWDSLRINWGEVTLTNGSSQIRLPYNMQVPLKEKNKIAQPTERWRLHCPPNGPSRAHLVYGQYHPRSLPCSPGSMNPLPPSIEEETA